MTNRELHLTMQKQMGEFENQVLVKKKELAALTEEIERLKIRAEAARTMSIYYDWASDRAE